MLIGRTSLELHKPTPGRLFAAEDGLIQRLELEIRSAGWIRRCAGLTFLAGGSGEGTTFVVSYGGFHILPIAALGDGN